MAQVTLSVPIPQAKGTRNLFFDLLRGLLAWVIVLVHLAWLVGLKQTGAGTRVAIGQWSVEIFMILAGYVAIAYYRPESYLCYLQKRFWRIIPVLVVSWLLCFILGTDLKPAWFVTLLVQFYLVFPALMWLVQKFGQPFLGFLLVAGLFFLLPAVYDGLKRFAPMGEFLPMNFFWFALGMSAFYFLDQSVLESLSEGAKKFPLLIAAGQISYSTYLIHWPILFALDRILPPLNLPLHAAVLLLLALPSVALGSIILHQWVERPGVAIGAYQILRSLKGKERGYE